MTVYTKSLRKTFADIDMEIHVYGINDDIMKNRTTKVTLNDGLHCAKAGYGTISH